MSDTPILPFSTYFPAHSVQLSRGWQQHGKFKTSSKVWTSLAYQRGSDESGELVSNSHLQQNGQALICHTKEGQVNFSLKTHWEGPTSNILILVQPCGWVWFLQEAAGLEPAREEKCIWRRKQGISDAERNTKPGEEACSKQDMASCDDCSRPDSCSTMKWKTTLTQKNLHCFRHSPTQYLYPCPPSPLGPEFALQEPITHRQRQKKNPKTNHLQGSHRISPFLRSSSSREGEKHWTSGEYSCPPVSQSAQHH